MGKSKLNKLNNLSRRLLAGLLVIATLLTMFALPESAVEAVAETGVSVKNGMILKIDMGSVTTDQISYFAVKYYDTSNVIRTEIINPTSDNYKKSFELVEARIGTTSLSKKNSFLKNSKQSLGFTFGEGMTPLLPMKSTYFYFETLYDLKTVCGFSFFARSVTDGKNEIAIQDISIYKVNKLYDIDMIGNFSSEYFIDFLGIKCMSTKISRTFAWASADMLYDFSSTFYEDGTRVDLGEQFYSATFESDLTKVDAIREKDESLNLTFQIDIADVYGAGAEYLNSYVKSDGNSVDLYQGWIVEPLEIHATYTDESGVVRTVKVPVVLSTLYKAITESGNVTMNSRLSGLLQQGDSLVFDITLLNCKKLDKNAFVLVNGRDSVKTDIGFTWKNDKYKTTQNDSVNISAIRVYETSNITYTASASTGFLVPVVTGNPVLYYMSPLDQGTEIPEETTLAIPFAECNGSENFSGNTSTGKFLITLKTDTPSGSSTTSEVKVKIKYKNYKNEERESSEYLISESVANYYGYWPTNGGTSNVAYAIGTNVGQQMAFLVDIPDVDTFLGMTFSISAQEKDDWQGSAIGIFEIKSLGKRTVSWSTLSVNSIFTDRIISRDNDVENISPTLAGPFLVEPGSSTYVEFASGGSTVSDNDVDWEDYKYQMTYEEATQNLGFTKSRAVYTVSVKVSGDIVSGLVNENCGSNDNFYFKLVFEDGSTGYVLANQQLSSDGFVSGEEHEFYIIANRDMGNLSAIKILPESRDESEAFDKLMVDYITITKSNGEGLSLTWRVDVNAWITAEYKDTGAKDSSRGQKGRTESELAQTFKVGSRGYSLELMFAVETLEYIDNAFDGKLSAQIDYIDSDNVLQTKKIDDVIRKFADYAGRSSETKTYTPVNEMPTFTGTVIDRSYMLTANHTDRFFLTLTDVVKIVRIRFTVNSVTAGQWVVGGVSVYRILSKGNKMFNENGEYQYNGEVEMICQSSSTIPYTVQYTASGNDAVLPILFGDNKIDVDLSSTWISSISYVPQSNDDSINVYAYMASGADDINDYQMKMSATYSLADETTRETVAVLNPEASMKMFYAKDIKVSGLRNLRKLGLKADSFNAVYSPIDHVIVEHIRSGVVINTYYLNFNKQDVGSLSFYQYAKPSTEESGLRETETLTFMISNDSTPVKIINGTSDLAVCMNYTSTNDPEGEILTSPNLFVSSLGVTTLSPGDIVTFTFNQKNVKDVTSITFIGQGSVSNAIKVKAAKVSTQTTDSNGETEYNNFYSFGSEMTGFVSYSPKSMKVTATTSKNITIQNGTQKSVGLLTLGFETASGSSGLSSGTAVRVKIGYYDDYKMTKEMTISDISPYIVSGSFNPGVTAYATLLINGISSIRYITVEPYGGSGATWMLGKVSAKLSINSDGVSEERILNKSISTGNPEMIGFGNVKIQVVAYISKTGQTNKERRGFSSASDISEGILMTLGNDITFTPTIEGSISGINISCVNVAVTQAGDSVTSDVTNSVISKQYSGNATSGTKITGFTFRPKTAGDYRITVASEEIASTYVVINISVGEN